MRENPNLEKTIIELLDDPQYDGHPLRIALESLFQRYKDQLTQLERITSISDGFQLAMRDKNLSLTDRYLKQIRQLRKIVRISDQYQKMQRDINLALKEASTHDPLTDLPNRRYMLDRLNHEISSISRRNAAFSLALIDIDHFKQVNDEFGHEIGDLTLIHISQAMLQVLRGYDVCARWGGEEFLALMPQTSGESAVTIARRLCDTVRTLRHPDLPETLCVTISVGVAEHHDSMNVEDTLRRADQALYQAKGAGRNQVVLGN